MTADQYLRRIEIRNKAGQVVGTKDVVTYQGLLAKAHDEGLTRVRTRLLQIPDDSNGRTAIAKALVETAKGRFEAIGDATPDNVNSFIVPHLIRMAETRAKARALRDAVNVGEVSFEELNGDPMPSGEASHAEVPQATSGGSGNGAAMTEAQRRYLFRLMAGQGLETDAAHERLKELLGVTSLTKASKGAASRLIDELLRESEEAAGDYAQRE